MSNIIKVLKTTLKGQLSPTGLSFTVQQFIDSNSNKVEYTDFSGEFVVVLQQSDVIEMILCNGITQSTTDTSAVITKDPNGRDLNPKSPYTGGVSGKLFNTGANVIVSNDPHTMSRLASIDKENIFSELQTFNIAPQTPVVPTVNDDIVNKAYADGLAQAGAPDSSTTVKGIGEVSVAPVDPTNPIFVGDNDARIALQYGVDTGLINAYIVATPDPYQTLATGQKYAFKATTANTGSATIDINGFGAKAIFNKNAPLTGGEMLAGQITELQYDGTQFQMISPASIYMSKVTTYSPVALATQTLDLSRGSIFHINMPAGDVTLAIANATVGQMFIVRILQDSVGSRLVTWFSTIKWVGGIVPILTTTADKADSFGFEITASGTYDGYVNGLNI